MQNMVVISMCDVQSNGRHVKTIFNHFTSNIKIDTILHGKKQDFSALQILILINILVVFNSLLLK